MGPRIGRSLMRLCLGIALAAALSRSALGVVGLTPMRFDVYAREIWSRVVYGGQAASSVCMMSLAFLTPSLKVTPPTTSVSSSDLFSRLHPLCADSASL